MGCRIWGGAQCGPSLTDNRRRSCVSRAHSIALSAHTLCTCRWGLSFADPPPLLCLPHLRLRLLPAVKLCLLSLPTCTSPLVSVCVCTAPAHAWFALPNSCATSRAPLRSYFHLHAARCWRWNIRNVTREQCVCSRQSHCHGKECDSFPSCLLAFRTCEHCDFALLHGLLDLD